MKFVGFVFFFKKLRFKFYLIDAWKCLSRKIFSCACCCCWPFTLKHRNNTDTEKIVHSLRRPTKNRYRIWECDFCGSDAHFIDASLQRIRIVCCCFLNVMAKGLCAFYELQNITETDRTIRIRISDATEKREQERRGEQKIAVDAFNEQHTWIVRVSLCVRIQQTLKNVHSHTRSGCVRQEKDDNYSTTETGNIVGHDRLQYTSVASVCTHILRVTFRPLYA